MHDSNLVITIFDMFQGIYRKCAEKKLRWHETIEFNESIGEIVGKAVEEGLDEACRHAFYLLTDIMKTQLQYNCPKEDEIWMLSKNIKASLEREDYDKSLHWDYITRPFLGIMDSAVVKAIESERYNVIGNAMFSLCHFMQEVVAWDLKDKLGQKQKAFIIRQCCYHGDRWSTLCIQKGLWQKVIPFAPYSFFLINDSLKSKEEYSKWPLLSFANIVIGVSKMKLCDSHALNELGAVGRGAVESSAKDHFYEEVVVFILNVFNKIRDNIEDLSDANAREIYIETYKQAVSIKRWMEKDKGTALLREKVDDILSRFTAFDECNKLKQSEIVEWPEL